MSLRVAYLVSRFPKTSETFIVDEVLALEEAGVDVPLYALADGRGAPVGRAAAKLTERCIRLPLLAPGLLVAEARWLLRAPLRLLGLWGLVVVRHLRAPRDLARAIVAVSHAIAHASHMERTGVQHLHAHWATHTALAAWAVHRLTGLSYSFTAHADDIFVTRPMLDEKVRDAAFVVTISDFNRAFLIDRIGASSATPIEVVRCGVSAEEFQPAPAPAESTPFTIVCVARLEAKKGHVDLIDACAELVRRGIDLRCRLIGEGSRRGAIEARTSQLGIADRVELLGARKREEVRETIASAHVFVLPSVVDPDGRADGIPVALMEAMAMCRPVVTTRVTGIPELVEDEVSGLLVAPGDAGALAEAIDRVRLDPALRARLAETGRGRVLQDHDLHENIRRLRDLFVKHAAARPIRKSFGPALSSEAQGELR